MKFLPYHKKYMVYVPRRIRELQKDISDCEWHGYPSEKLYEQLSYYQKLLDAGTYWEPKF